MSLNNIFEYLKVFLDMDSFFASVEQQVQPPLRNRPIAVAPYTGNTGCVIAASITAKKQGIKTGFSVGKARGICPDIKIIEARPALYYLYHTQIVKAIYNISPFLKVLSIDEMTITLGLSERNHQAARKIALNIKKEVTKVGDYLTCSVGVGPNQFLAKVAAESEKPNALVILTTADLNKFYSKLELLDLPGINFQTEKALNVTGINTPLEMYLATQDKLTNLFGHMGKTWYLRLRGYEVDDIKSVTRTIGHSYVLPPKYRERNSVKKILIKLASKIGYRLRKKQLQAQCLSLMIIFINTGGKRKFLRTNYFSDTRTLIKLTIKLLEQISFTDIPITIYLTAFDLTTNIKQNSLFPGLKKSMIISEAIDKINEKYGTGTIYAGEMFGFDDAAPDRIPFGNPDKQNYLW